ncbi:hypothetical protein K1719_028177 [Acacia pycnantha]|nr:hypothetical protein K1719_028177 [Acacia pycnantha]
MGEVTSERKESSDGDGGVPAEDQNLMGDEDASLSSTDLHDLINYLNDFDLERCENRTSNLEDLFNDPNSQSLESEVTPIEMHNASQDLELEDFQNHPIYLPPELEIPPNVFSSQILELEVHPSHPNSQLPPPSNKRQKTSNEQRKLEYERTMIMEKRNNTVSHNPSAFGKIINQGKPRISCHCPKNKCSKRYCPCYKAGVGCSDLCHCKGCSNKYGPKNKGASSTSNSSFSPRERALITTLSNNISLINERQLDGGFKTLTHNNLYGSDTNQQAVYGTPATNPFDPPPIVQIAVVAQPGANPFAPSRNISQPHANQMAATTQPQVNLYTADQPQQQHMLMSPANSVAVMNPFAPSRNISQPHANQMAATTRPQVNLYTADQPQQQNMLMSSANSFAALNPFAPSRNISQPHANQMAATTQPQVNLYTADQPQQQHMLMSPANSVAVMNPFAPSRNISQPHANQMAATTRPQVNLYTADQPQQQNMLMSSANSFAAVNPFAPSRNISQPHVSQMAATTLPQVNLYTADQPQQQHMLMSPANSSAAASGSSPMRLPPRFDQEVNDIFQKYRSRE